jgi:DNA-binding response OmpR family regulator
MRIAVLNDSNELIDLITGGLTRVGFETTGVSLTRLWQDSSAPAVLLRYFHPKIAIIDVLFPFEGNWRYVTELLTKKNPRLIVIFTVTDMEGSKKIIGNLQNPFYLIKKPYYLSEIIGTVEGIRLSLDRPSTERLQPFMHT